MVDSVAGKLFEFGLIAGQAYLLQCIPRDAFLALHLAFATELLRMGGTVPYGAQPSQ